MRTLYTKCHLVHGDLSEYNILYFEVSERRKVHFRLNDVGELGCGQARFRVL